MVDQIRKQGKLLKGKKLYLRHPTSAASPASSTLDRSPNLSGPLGLRFPTCEIHSTHFSFVKLGCFCIAFQLIWPNPFIPTMRNQKPQRFCDLPKETQHGTWS